MASESASWLRRGADIFLGRILLAYFRRCPWLLCSRVVHGDLFGDLGVVLRSAATTVEQEGLTRREQMGSDAGPGQKRRSAAAIAVDKIDEKYASPFNPR